jgi:hypothetical protein
LKNHVAAGNNFSGKGAVMAERALPHWPRRMKLHLAAAYVDESESKFLTGVKAGKWPAGTRDGGNVYWFLEDLDAALDRLKPVGATRDDGWGDFLGKA